MIRILPYKKGSKSYKQLRRFFKGKTNNTQHPTTSKILNWGCNQINFNTVTRVFNKPNAVKVASNKLLTFNKLKESNVPTVDFTQDVEKVKEWLRSGKKVLARTLKRAHSGRGIVLMRQEQDLVSASLYTKYHNKKQEFRVHVFNGKVIDYCEKKKRRERPENFNKYIRSHDNGWVYVRQEVLLPSLVKETSIKAVQALGLDFGAVDVIVTTANKVLILEVNTAPGLEGQTVQKYVDAIRELDNE